MINIKKKEGESTSALLFRFTKKVKQSGVLTEARKRRFRGRAKNKRARRISAVYRTEKRKDMARKRRLGIL